MKTLLILTLIFNFSSLWAQESSIDSLSEIMSESEEQDSITLEAPASMTEETQPSANNDTSLPAETAIKTEVTEINNPQADQKSFEASNDNNTNSQNQIQNHNINQSNNQIVDQNEPLNGNPTDSQAENQTDNQAENQEAVNELSFSSESEEPSSSQPEGEVSATNNQPLNPSTSPASQIIENQNEVQSANPKNANGKSQQGQNAKGVDQNAAEAVSSQNQVAAQPKVVPDYGQVVGEQQYKITCILNDDIRVLKAIKQADGSVGVVYTRFGETKTIALAKNDPAYADQVVNKIYNNLANGTYPYACTKE